MRQDQARVLTFKYVLAAVLMAFLFQLLTGSVATGIRENILKATDSSATTICKRILIKYILNVHVCISVFQSNKVFFI